MKKKNWFKRKLCALRHSGHYFIRAFERSSHPEAGHRVFLRCLQCGEETPGFIHHITSRRAA